MSAQNPADGREKTNASQALSSAELSERKNEFKKTIIRHGATIGANATIVCGITIGEYAFVGAGSVITKDVPSFALVVGNPARQIGWIDKGGLRMQFDENGIAKDSYDGEEYCLKDGAIEVIRRNL